MRRVAGQDATCTRGQLWLMAYGAYSVYVTVDGARGSGTAIVPVNSFATGRLPLSRGLGAILVGARRCCWSRDCSRSFAPVSARVSCAPGEPFDPTRRRRANVVAAIARADPRARSCSAARSGGSPKTRAISGHMYGSPARRPDGHVDATHRTLRLAVHDTAAFRRDLCAGDARSREDDASLS